MNNSPPRANGNTNTASKAPPPSTVAIQTLVLCAIELEKKFAVLGSPSSFTAEEREKVGLVAQHPRTGNYQHYKPSDEDILTRKICRFIITSYANHIGFRGQSLS